MAAADAERGGERLAAWITHPQNRRFERATANRIWGLLFGRPLHSPVDDLPDPPTDGPPDVLDLVGADFREHHYDLRHMIRVIVASRPFQVDSAQEEASPQKNATDEANWSVFPMTRLRPEQLIGSILQSTSPRTIDQNSHLFVRAKRFFQENEFVKQYGDLGDNELDERSGTIAQALLRMNGKLASDALCAKDMSASSRITSFADTDEKCVEACYLVALSRRPTKAESDYFVPQLACAEKSRTEGCAGSGGGRHLLEPVQFTGVLMEPLKHTGSTLDWFLGLSRRDVLRAAGALGVSFLLPALESAGGQRAGQSPAEVADHDLAGRGAQPARNVGSSSRQENRRSDEGHLHGRQGTRNRRLLPAIGRRDRCTLGHPFARFEGRGSRAGFLPA